MRVFTVLLAAGMLCFTSVRLIAAEPLAWPQFRGPGGSGVADDQRPPIEIGPDKNVKWKVAAPGGWSSPVVAGDKLVITAFDGGKLYTIAYLRASGEEAWRKEAPARQIEKYLKNEGSPAASSPVTDGRRIIAYFGSCGLFCYDLSGNQLWHFELPTVATAGDLGSGVSPILADGVVIVVRDQASGSRILAVDATTGKQVWERKRESPASYSTPLAWDTPSGKQIVVAGHGRLIAYDLKTGAEVWTVNGMPSGCCPSPVAADGTLYFAGWSPGGPDDPENQMPTFDAQLKNLDKDKDGALSKEEADQAFGGFFDGQDANKDGKVTRDEYEVLLTFMRQGVNIAFALRSGGTGDITNSHVLWKNTRGLPYIASAILYRGQYVMVKDGGIVTAYDAQTGKEIYMQRAAAGGKYYASPVAANGHLYLVSLEDGTVTVVKAGLSRPEVVATSAKLGERVAATPAIADDTLYIRTEQHLYAFTGK
jgi:outer membrane protein assembly factor BamB